VVFRRSFLLLAPVLSDLLWWMAWYLQTFVRLHALCILTSFCYISGLGTNTLQEIYSVVHWSRRQYHHLVIPYEDEELPWQFSGDPCLLKQYRGLITMTAFKRFTFLSIEGYINMLKNHNYLKLYTVDKNIRTISNLPIIFHVKLQFFKLLSGSHSCPILKLNNTKKTKKKNQQRQQQQTNKPKQIIN